MDQDEFIEQHVSLTRRYFCQIGLAGASILPHTHLVFGDEANAAKRQKPEKAGAQREPYFTPTADFRDVSRGMPLPHSLSDEKKREVGLTRETWSLDVISDPDKPATLGKQLRVGEPMAVSGYAQVGVSGLSKVQVAMELVDKSKPLDDLDFANSPWVDAELLPAPTTWSGLSDGRVPSNTHGFNDDGTPKRWPIRFTNAHWVAVLPGVAAGDYTFRCRTIDERGIAQPMPRPFRKSGHAAIESLSISVKD